jgi:probable HAF family extracellular repeat protein
VTPFRLKRRRSRTVKQNLAPSPAGPAPPNAQRLRAFLRSLAARREISSIDENAINAAGRIAGWSNTRGDNAIGPVHAFLYANGAMTDLGTLGGSTSVASGINAHGDVVGSADIVNADGSRVPHAFRWQGGMTDLGTLGGPGSVATAINDAGQIAGFSTTVDGATHAIIYEAGQMRDLGTLGGSWSRALDINRWGQVVGLSPTGGDAAVHAFT